MEWDPQGRQFRCALPAITGAMVPVHRGERGLSVPEYLDGRHSSQCAPPSARLFPRREQYPGLQPDDAAWSSSFPDGIGGSKRELQTRPIRISCSSGTNRGIGTSLVWKLRSSRPVAGSEVGKGEHREIRG